VKAIEIILTLPTSMAVDTQEVNKSY